MGYLNEKEFSEYIGWTEKNVIKRYCLGLPMPPSVKIPRSKKRLWKKVDVDAWLDKYYSEQAKNDDHIAEVNSMISKGKEVRKRRGRPRRPVNMNQLEKMVANA